MIRFLIFLKIIFSLFVGANVAQAETRNFTLDCDNDRKWPSGVPATLTKYENLRVFRDWCDAAGTSSLQIVMKHGFEMRALEGLGLPENVYSNDTKIIVSPLLTEATSSQELAAFVESLPKVPAAGLKYTYVTDYTSYWSEEIRQEYRLEAYYVGASTITDPSFQFSDYAERFESVVYVNGELFVSAKGQGTYPYPNEVCAYLNQNTGSFEIKGHCYFKVRHKYVKKKTCKPHSSYIFLNPTSNEVTSNFIDGGSCYRYKGARFVVPDQGPRLESEYTESFT